LTSCCRLLLYLFPIASPFSFATHAWQRTIFWHFLHKTDFSALTEISAGRRWFLDALALE
jgi:hypothetical protein